MANCSSRVAGSLDVENRAECEPGTSGTGTACSSRMQPPPAARTSAMPTVFDVLGNAAPGSFRQSLA